LQLQLQLLLLLPLLLSVLFPPPRHCHPERSLSQFHREGRSRRTCGCCCCR